MAEHENITLVVIRLTDRIKALEDRVARAENVFSDRLMALEDRVLNDPPLIDLVKIHNEAMKQNETFDLAHRADVERMHAKYIAVGAEEISLLNAILAKLSETNVWVGGGGHSQLPAGIGMLTAGESKRASGARSTDEAT